MWRDLWIVLVVVAVFLLCLSQFEMHDTKTFSCLLREEKARRSAPVFVPLDDTPPAYVARGTLACVEDVVAFANEKRAGPDGVIGTPDDTLTIEEQLDVLGASLEANFGGSYWVYSPFFNSYEHYGSAVLTQVLFADVDEVLLLRVAPAGSSFVINAGGNERHLFPIDGSLSVIRGAPLRSLLLRATSLNQKLAASTPVGVTALRVKAGRKLLVGVPEDRGVVFLEHITAHVPRAAFTLFAVSSLFYGFDIQSALTAISALYKSLHRNLLLPLSQLLWDGEESSVPAGGGIPESERGRRKAEQQALSDTVETREEEQFNEDRRLELQAKQQAAKAAQQRPIQQKTNQHEQQEQQQQQQEQQQQEQQQQDEDDEDEEEEEDEDVGHDEL